MKILIINNGSTSSRFQFYDTDRQLILAEGGAENINTDTSYYKYKSVNSKSIKEKMLIGNYDQAFNIMLSFLFHKDIGVIRNKNEIDAISHRVVHGADLYNEATLINDNVLNNILYLAEFSPIHNLNTYKSIKNCFNEFGNIPNVAIFDTAFHQTIPEHNFLYPIPKEYYEKYKIRKYGFHGISYNYSLNRYSQLTNIDKEKLNLIICHMGGGCSMCCVKNGKSYDTTMGFTPVSGLMMASRSGSIDPSMIPYLMEKENLSAKEIITMLNNESGYLAIANDKDAKSIVERSENNDEDAILLRKMIDKDFKYNLMSMLSNMDRVDSIILTGGMSAKNYQQREMFLSNLELFGISIDKELNKKIFDEEAQLNAKDSKFNIFLIPANEELEMANQTIKVLNRR